jgi:hypothetical protein
MEVVDYRFFFRENFHDDMYGSCVEAISKWEIQLNGTQHASFCDNIEGMEQRESEGVGVTTREIQFLIFVFN